MSRTIAPTADFAAQIDRINSQLNEARAEQSRLALKLAEDPADASISTQLDQIEHEITGYQRNITRMQIARQAAERRDSAEARAERLAQARAGHARIVKTGPSLAKIGQSIEQLLGQLAPLLAQWQGVIEDRTADMYAVMREVAPHHLRDSSRWRGMAMLHNHNIATALARTVVASGLARTGPSLDPYVTVSEPSAIVNADIPLADAITSETAKLADDLGRFIDQHAQKLEAKNG